ncbi:hypothetical protein V6Z11_A12G146100 [Gossypium hirsutum]
MICILVLCCIICRQATLVGSITANHETREMPRNGWSSPYSLVPGHLRLLLFHAL